MTDANSWDRLALWVAAAASTTIFWCWAGAALASALTGTPPPPLSDAGAALAALPRQLGQPAAAWPNANHLPGAGIYWSAQVLATAALAAAAFTGWRWLRPADVDGLGVTRSASFARRRDLARLRVSGPVPGRVILGTAAGHLVAGETRNSVCVVGASQSGKTTGLLIPAILDMAKGHGSLLAVSVKGDLLSVTRARRKAIGDVKVFDPTLVAVKRSSTWSPLRSARTVTGAQSAARGLVEVAGSDGLEDSKYWMDAAFMLIWPLLFVASNSGKAMRDVVRWITTHDRPSYSDDGRLTDPGDVWSHLNRLRDLACIAAGDTLEHPDTQAQTEADKLAAAGCTLEHVDLASDALTGTWSIDERTRSNIYATARALVEAWSDPVVATSADGCEITPEWLLGGDNSLYIVAPARDQARLRPVFACLIADLINAAFDEATRRGGTLEGPLVAALDEVANIAPIRELPAWCSTCASHGIVLLTVWQDRSQQRSRYGQEGAETIWNNSGAKVVLSGLADHATSEVGSLLGEEDYQRRSTSVDLAGPGSSRRSLSEQAATRRLVTEDALRRQRPGQALLVYRDLPPARLTLRAFYNDRRLRSLVPDEVITK